MIWYSWGLAGPEGAWFILYREEKHSDANISEAKKWLRNNHDVVTIRIENFEKQADEIVNTAKKDIKHFEEMHNLKL